MATSGALELPSVLSPVSLYLWLPEGGSAEVSSLVCDVEVDGDSRGVVVHRPDLRDVPEPGRFPHGSPEVRLAWNRPTGRMQLAVAATAANRRYGPVWVLTPVGAPTREQRREYFRIPLTVPAVITPVVEEVADPPDDGSEVAEVAPLRGTLVDVSEGGAVVCSDGDLPEVGTVVEVSFTLEDRAITARSLVLRHERPLGGRPRVAVRFLDPSAHGDHIRRVGFAVQRARARARVG